MNKLVVSDALDDPLNLFKIKSHPISKETHDSLRFLKEERGERWAIVFFGHGFDQATEPRWTE